ncbi:NACHT, LRR and PYD domains-containing protein 3-like [Engystomops pustulosus]|uniref:NACHT, LRR and PYD domains-containing protein 3-like n=1 Tax=Engystomops pustulosus TaxID=76066 RepID=UPI003AFA1964
MSDRHPSDDDFKILDKHGHQLPPQLRDLQNSHKKYLYDKSEKIIKNNPLRNKLEEKNFPFHYSNLIIVSNDHLRERFKNVLKETALKHEDFLSKEHIFPDKFFHWSQQSTSVPHMVMVVGVTGVGKTTLMQKIVYDWVKGDLYQRFSFVFFFTFRELNRLDKVSLETMILQHYPYLENQLWIILRDREKLLFIFDGLDESNQTMDFTSGHLISDPKQPEPCGHIVGSLVRKSLLNGCSVLMTSHPSRLTATDRLVFQCKVEIMGILTEERRIFYENFFLNPKQSEEAFTYVNQNDSLYPFCYLPAYCWIICTVLSKSFQTTRSDQQVSLLPKTVTQLFAIFVANILSNHSLKKSGAQKLLQSMGWMAEHGVLNRRIIFDDRDLESFHVDNKSKLFSSFLMELKEPVSYSFLHLTLQEFFSALVHYVDYSTEKLQKSLKDGRSEIFLRFLCGLSDASTRSILTGYLDTQADQASREVITWLKDLAKHQLVENKTIKRYHLKTFFYFFEAQNKALVQESLNSYTKLDFSGFAISALDCTVLASIMESCTNIKEINLTQCSIDHEKLGKLAPMWHNLQELSLAGNDLPDTSCIQLAYVIRNNPSLKRLDLSNNHLSGPNLSDLMDALSSPDCVIEEL